MSKLRKIKWVIIVLVRPLIMSWIVIEGLPGVIRATGHAIAAVVKAFK